MLRYRYQTVEFGELDIHLRTLRDTDQFADPDGAAADLGISESQWSLFGVLWDSGRVLARLMADHDVADRRVLEVGCGIGLASLVLNRRDADITAVDLHPEAEGFLAVNTALNDGEPIPFVQGSWHARDLPLGRFGLIIGSDLLYDRDQTGSLSGFVACHAEPTCEVVLADPGRRHVGAFTREMDALGFSHSRTLDAVACDTTGKQVRVHVYRRVAPA